METIYLPKIKEGETHEKNSGHTESEWGEIKVRQNDLPTIIPVYKMRWETIPE